MKKSNISNRNEEFNKDSSKNLTPDHKDSGDFSNETPEVKMNSDNLFSRMESSRDDSQTNQLHAEALRLAEEITNLEQTVDARKTKITELKDKLENQRYYDSRRNAPEIVRNEKLLLKNQILDLQTANILDNQKLSDLNARFTTIQLRIKKALEHSKTSAKAASRDWMRKNSNLVKAKILAFLSKASSDHSAQLLELKSAIGQPEFSEKLRDLVYEIDAEVYVLISGLSDLKAYYFTIIENTLKSWDDKDGSVIEELVINDEEAKS